MNYLKIGQYSDLEGRDRVFYRFLEILPGFLSWATLLILILLSYTNPVFVAYFIIAFDVYWLLLVIYLGIHLFVSYGKMKKTLNVNWQKKCQNLSLEEIKEKSNLNFSWEDLKHLVFFPIYNESYFVVKSSVDAILKSPYPLDKIIIIFAVEGRGGEEVLKNVKRIQEEIKDKISSYVYVHPDNIEGEIKGKGSNQAWAAKKFKKEVVDKNGWDYDKLLVSVFDIDTIIYPYYFYVLAYKFLTSPKPYRASYQPIPVYHNNIWQAPFFARVAASSNTFWQMMQQIRAEKLATYSSHSMTWRALVDIGFWSTNMVSEDSRIFWHCFCYYNGDYRVEPMYYPVSMDVCMDETTWQTAKNLYKQQRRWGWGVENVPYLIFNTVKRWNKIPKKNFLNKIFTQIYGFHSWATNALIIGFIGWLPMLLGGDRFNSTVLSTNLPLVSRYLMNLAMSGLVFSAIISTMLLPKKPKKYSVFKKVTMLLQWLLLPLSIVIFGSIPGLEAQTRLMFNKRLGFWVTPKAR